MKNNPVNFYNDLASSYHLLFEDWNWSINYHSKCIEKILHSYQKGKNEETHILDCSCGIGTQSIGLSLRGYNIIGTDISRSAIKRARKEAKIRGANAVFRIADFRKLGEVVKEKNQCVISFDNALPHMETKEELRTAIEQIYNVLDEYGIFIASIRDYDKILKERPKKTEPYVYHEAKRTRIVFQTWKWNDDKYDLDQYIVINNNGRCKIKCFSTRYRATKKDEISELMKIVGFRKVKWIDVDQSGYFQPIVIGIKAKI